MVNKLNIIIDLSKVDFLKPLQEKVMECDSGYYDDDGDWIATHSDDPIVNYTLSDVVKMNVENRITENVTDALVNKINSSTEKKLVDLLTAKINESLDQLVSDKLAEFIETGGKVKRYGVDTTLSEHIQEKVNVNSDRIMKTVSSIVAEKYTGIVDELQDRYDMQFALGLINQLTDKGFIDREVAKSLLNNNQTKK